MKQRKYHRLIILLLLLLLSPAATAQSRILHGTVTDSLTKKPVELVSVYIKETRQGAVADSTGKYSLSIPEDRDSISLTISCVGYITKKLKISCLTKELEIQLSSNIMVWGNGLIIIDDRAKNNISTEKLTPQELRLLPSLTGDPDIIRTYSLLPGVTTGGEGTAGLYVRGGSPDQNLIQLDGFPLYYINHLGNFISVFDADAIGESKLIKGGFPARYGGRLSSVLDIEMKEGNSERLNKSFSIGLVATKFNIEGPLSNKTSILFSARVSMLPLLMYPASYIISEGSQPISYFFTDLNLKLSHRFSAKDKLLFSAYYGYDLLYWGQKEELHTVIGIMDGNSESYTIINKNNSYMKNGWGNTLFGLDWEHIFGEKLKLNTRAGFTRFIFEKEFYVKRKQEIPEGAEVYPSFMHGGNGESTQIFRSSVNDWSVKSELKYFIHAKHTLLGGLAGIFHIFRPAADKFTTNSDNIHETIYDGNTRLQNFDLDFYAEDEWKISKKWNANIGLRVNAFFTDSKVFFHPQPRLSVNYQPTNRLSFQSGVSLMTQNLHLLSSSGIGMPANIWVPATADIPAQQSWQYVLGAKYNFPKQQSFVSAEFFYKTLNHLVDFKEDVAFYQGLSNWQYSVETNGKGNVYGLELLLRKTAGKTTGWLAYTLSYNNREFENINNGQSYPYRYDNRHNFSLVLMHALNKKWSISGTFTYITGDAISLPSGEHPLPTAFYNNYDNGFGTTAIPDYAYVYDGKNQSRMPDYHRLDLGITYTKRKKKSTVEWNFSIYNVYNRANPYSLYIQRDRGQTAHLYQLSLFSIIPSFNYRISW